jgi:hypothetical protein
MTSKFAALKEIQADQEKRNARATHQKAHTATGHSRMQELERMRNKEQEAYEGRQLMRSYRDPRVLERMNNEKVTRERYTASHHVEPPSLESLDAFPSLSNNGTLAASCAMPSWKHITTKAATAKDDTFAASPLVVSTKVDDKNYINITNKTIHYIEDPSELFSDLLANERLEKVITDKRKCTGPDQSGFRTVVGKNVNVKKTYY